MAAPDTAWDRFVDRAIEAAKSGKEGALYALFYYQAEVNNGGHHQYFHNWAKAEVWMQAVKGARSIGENAVARNLEAAIQVWQSSSRKRPGTIDEFMQEAREEELELFDSQFYDLHDAFQLAFKRAVTEDGGA